MDAVFRVQNYSIHTQSFTNQQKTEFTKAVKPEHALFIYLAFICCVKPTNCTLLNKSCLNCMWRPGAEGNKVTEKKEEVTGNLSYPAYL